MCSFLEALTPALPRVMAKRASLLPSLPAPLNIITIIITIITIITIARTSTATAAAPTIASIAWAGRGSDSAVMCMCMCMPGPPILILHELTQVAWSPRGPCSLLRLWMSLRLLLQMWVLLVLRALARKVCCAL